MGSSHFAKVLGQHNTFLIYYLSRLTEKICTSYLWMLWGVLVPSVGRAGLQADSSLAKTLESLAGEGFNREACLFQGRYREQNATLLSSSKSVRPTIHKLRLDERLVRIRKWLVQAQTSFTSSEAFSGQTIIIAVSAILRQSDQTNMHTHLHSGSKIIAMCLSQHQPKEHLWDQGAAGLPGNLWLKGLADFPRSCWDQHLEWAWICPQTGQVRRYRGTCTECWGTHFGTKERCCALPGSTLRIEAV